MSRAESKAATRTELLDAARRVFVERGYHGASLDLVAREAGYTKGAVYSAFGGKGQMFLAVWEREVEQRWSRIEREAAGSDPADIPARTGEDWLRAPAQRARLDARAARVPAARRPRSRAQRALRRWPPPRRRAPRRAPRSRGGRAERSREGALEIVALSNGWALEHLALPDEATEERYAGAARAIIESLRR